MRRWLVVAFVLLCHVGAVEAHGILIPEDRSIAPLAMASLEVNIAIEDQVAVTRVKQTFRNHTSRKLEATYLFPVPRGAGVNDFSMVVDGKQVKGEMVERSAARALYSDAVRRTQDPGLLEYLGNDLMKLQVLVPPGDVQIHLSYTAVLAREGGIIEYVYPLKTDGRATSTLKTFSIAATLKAQHALQAIYSPTHAIGVHRRSDREARIEFEKQQALLDKDFQLLFTVGENDIGLTALGHRPAGADRGHFLLLLSPRAELAQQQTMPRDLVLVLDTSGSMGGPAIGQARRALKYCLDRLNPKDRFALVTFATIVNKYGNGLADAGPEQVERAKKWVDGLNAEGATNIHDALIAALDLRPREPGRPFTIVFFTDGLPTVGEKNPAEILKKVLARNTANTRIFTFGFGHEVNATLLDQLAQQTRAASSYVRPGEDIEAKVSGLYNKISQPVLVNLRLTSGPGIQLEEMYPPTLPDLFHGGQVMVLGRYTGQGKTTITLQGNVGTEEKKFDYQVDFPDKTQGRDYVETIWARRKIGYLLDMIRTHGENKELVEATVSLAQKYGIATPYTSYLIVPEAALPVVNFGQANPSVNTPGKPSPKGSKSPPLPNTSSYPFQGQPNPYGGGIIGGQFGGGQFGGGMGGNPFGGQFGGGMMGMGGMMMGGTPGPGMQGGAKSAGQGSASSGGFKFRSGLPGKMTPAPLDNGGGGTSSQQPSASAGSKPGQQLASTQGGWAYGFQPGQMGQFGNNQWGLFGPQGNGLKLVDFAKMAQPSKEAVAGNRGQLEDELLGQGQNADRVLAAAKRTKEAYDQARAALAQKQKEHVQGGKLGVDLSVQSNLLRDQSRIALSAQRTVAGRRLLEIGGAWIDDGFDAGVPSFTIQALSPAYFRLLERQPHLRELFQLGNYLVYVTPSGTALIIDLEDGHEKLGDAALDYLFRKRGT